MIGAPFFNCRRRAVSLLQSAAQAFDFRPGVNAGGREPGQALRGLGSRRRFGREKTDRDQNQALSRFHTAFPLSAAMVVSPAFA